MDATFIKGADISSLPEMLDNRKVYYDTDGKQCEPLALLKQGGINWIRLRIWNEPGNVPASGGYCGLDATVKFAKRVKDAGFKLLLDFHYSDWWADPGKQNKPKAWEGLALPALADALYEYTVQVLNTLARAGAYPEMVQIGNEIRAGMLWPEGSPENWDGLAALLLAGIRAVRDTQDGRDTQIMIHLDQGGRYYYFRDWFDEAISRGVTDFDVIGLSYYPFWHGGFSELRYTLDYLAGRYGRPLIVAETAHAWNTGGGMFSDAQEKAAGFTADAAGQRRVIELVMSITAKSAGGLGRGVIYWEPMMLPTEKSPGGWGFGMGQFGHDGRALEGFKAWKFDPYAADGGEVAKVYPARRMRVPPGETPVLPPTIKVLRRDGLLEDRRVRWTLPDCYPQSGTSVITGEVCGTELTASVEITFGEADEAENLIVNGDFESGTDGWTFFCSNESAEIEVRPDFAEPFPAPPEHYLSINSPGNFKLTVSQAFSDLPPGRYALTADIEGDNTTGVDISLRSEAANGSYETGVFLSGGRETYAHSFTHDGGTVTVSLVMESPPIRVAARNFRFVAKEGN